jgi:hypothetical protein
MCPKIRCNEKSEKFCKIFWELNRATEKILGLSGHRQRGRQSVSKDELRSPAQPRTHTGKPAEVRRSTDHDPQPAGRASATTPGRRSPAAAVDRVPWKRIELGPGPCYLKMGHGTIFFGYDPKYGMTRHEYEGRVVPRMMARWATWPGPYIGSCLGRHDTKI